MPNKQAKVDFIWKTNHIIVLDSKFSVKIIANQRPKTLIFYIDSYKSLPAGNWDLGLGVEWNVTYFGNFLLNIDFNTEV